MYICTEKQGHKSQTRADQKKKKVNKKQQFRAINLKFPLSTTKRGPLTMNRENFN